MKKVIIKDLEAIKKEYGFERKTAIENAEEAVFEEEKVKEQEVVFLMDHFGYAKTIDPAAYEKNVETIDAENKYVLRCMNTDRICIFTQTGMVHQLKVTKLPLKKPKDKGIPIDNLCNYTSATEDIIQICPLSQLKMNMMLFTTKKGMMKFVDASEFDISSITGGSDDGFNEFFDPDDQLTFEFIDINDGTTSEEVLLDEDEEPKEAEAGPQEEAAFTTNKMAVLQTKDGVFLRFKLSEIPSKHKGAVGVRGIRLNKDDEIDKVYIVGFGDKTSIQYHNKEVELMKLKLAKRDTRGTKLRQ